MNLIKGKPVIRCSSLDQLLSCPGSRTIAAKLGEIKDDERDSWEGNWCHYTAARRFIDVHGAMEPEGGLPPPRVPKDWKPESFADWIVDFYVHAVMERTPADWAMEVETEMLAEFPGFWLSGHVDEDAVSPDASEVDFNDLKSGINLVDMAECNWQVLGYATLFKCSYPNLARCRGRIIQPRIPEDVGERVTEVVIEGERMAAIVPFMNERITAALADPRQLNSGPKQCRWCPADLQCPAYKEDANDMKMKLTDEALAAIEATPNDQLLAWWCIMKKHLGPKLEKAAEMTKARLEVVKEIVTPEGSKVFLVDALSSREFISEQAKISTWEHLAETLDEPRAYACMSLSFDDMERQYAGQLKLPIDSKKKDCGKAQVKARFGPLITRKPTKKMVVVV